MCEYWIFSLRKEIFYVGKETLMYTSTSAILLNLLSNLYKLKSKKGA